MQAARLAGQAVHQSGGVSEGLQAGQPEPVAGRQRLKQRWAVLRRTCAVRRRAAPLLGAFSKVPSLRVQGYCWVPRPVPVHRRKCAQGAGCQQVPVRQVSDDGCMRPSHGDHGCHLSEPASASQQPASLHAAGLSLPAAQGVVRPRHAACHGHPHCSTLIEEISGSSLSRGMDRRVWPFDLTHGVKTNCR